MDDVSVNRKAPARAREAARGGAVGSAPYQGVAPQSLKTVPPLPGPPDEAMP